MLGVTLLLYIVMIWDRHKDPEPFVFTEEATAIAYAKFQMRVLANWDEDDIDETPIEGWLYSGQRKTAEDSIWVVSKYLDYEKNALRGA